MKSQTTSSGKTKPGSSSPWLAVVDARAEDLARVRERGEKAVDSDGVGGLRRGRGRLEPALSIADQAERVRVTGGEDLAAKLDAAACGLAASVLNDPHRTSR